jgi:hypothetical protein
MVPISVADVIECRLSVRKKSAVLKGKIKGEKKSTEARKIFSQKYQTLEALLHARSAPPEGNCSVKLLS